MSWYQAGLTLDLDTLDGTGALRAMLLDATYTHDPLHDMTDLELVEASGGAYARVDVPDVVVDKGTGGLVRIMSAAPLLIQRPASAFGWIALYRDADEALVLAIAFTDNLRDPVEILWEDEVIGSRVVAD